MRLRLLSALLCLTACGQSAENASQPAAAQALVAADRSTHLLARPYPSDELLTVDGTVELLGFPLTGPSIGKTFMAGWLNQVRSSVRGFSALTPVYFRFDADPAAAARYESRPGDDIQLYSLDSEHRVPVRVLFAAETDGDPYLPPNTLRLAPEEAHPLRSGERYAALVSTRLARAPEGWAPPAELVDREVAVATVFTVQNHTAELAALRRAADAFFDASPEFLVPAGGLREVASLRFEQGATPSASAATLEIVTFADGASEVTYLDDKRSAPDRTIDLTSGPMAVYQATIQTAAFQSPSGRPYQSPGLGIIFDTERRDGWIAFDAGAALRTSPHTEPMRIVVQVPRGGRTGLAVLLWAHGSGGDAYEAVARTDASDDLLGVRQALADAGAAVVSLDQPLFGRRFDLIDRGYANNLAIVNIPNLPAFRDSVRQGAVDQHALARFARDVLPALVGDGVVDPRRIGLFGHSIGAQIAGIGAALATGDLPSRTMINGTGGFVTHSVLASDLLSLRGGDTATAIFGLAGIEPPEDPTPTSILGALFGVPEAGWHRIDRHHPLSLPFQLVVDAADPLAVAPAQVMPITVFHGLGDTYVPADGARWIADASPAGDFVGCEPSSSYDGHVCIFREPTGREALARFITQL